MDGNNIDKYSPEAIGAKPYSPDAFDPISIGAKPYQQGTDINKSAGLLGATTAAQEKLQQQNSPLTPEAMAHANPEQLNKVADLGQQAQEANNQATIPNILGKSAGDTFGGAVNGVANTILHPIDSVVNPMMKGLGSAILSPIDVVRQFFGKKPSTAKINQIGAEPTSTIQSNFAENTAPAVARGEINPIVAGANTVADIAGTGSMFLGIKPALRDIQEMASSKLASRTENKGIKALSATDETMNKSQRIDAQDRLRPTAIGGKEYTPNNTELRANEMIGKKMTGNPVKDLQTTRDEISKQGHEAEQYLEKNSKPISNKEHFDIFANKRAEASKHLTDTELKTYDEQVKMFSKQLPGRGGYNTDNYYKALKEYESNIVDKLPKGKDALIDPTGIANAKLRAASDVRKVVRDMIGTKNPEFKPKMFDLTSLYDVKDTLAIKADQMKGNIFTRTAEKIPFVKPIIRKSLGR